MEEKMEREMGDMRKKMEKMKTETDEAAKVDNAHYVRTFVSQRSSLIKDYIVYNVLVYIGFLRYSV